MWLKITVAAAVLALLPAPADARRPDPVVYMRALAARYWGVLPCGGQYRVIADGTLPDPTRGAWSNWFGTSPPFHDCAITFAPRDGFATTAGIYASWGYFCGLFLHETGHLTGHAHSPNPENVMYPDGMPYGPPSVCLTDPSGYRVHMWSIAPPSWGRPWGARVRRPNVWTIPMDRRPALTWAN